jgi:sigma-B regulation protein RsbU (phosphoserine phosphatase)
MGACTIGTSTPSSLVTRFSNTLAMVAENGQIASGGAVGGVRPGGHEDERIDDAVPRWLFAVRAPAWQLFIGLCAAVVVAAPFLLSERPDDHRPGPVFLFTMILAAAIAGWRAGTLSGLLLWLVYWWLIPPSDSFAIDSYGGVVAVASMGFAALGLSLLTWRLQRAVDDVRIIDERRTELVDRERALRTVAESAARQSTELLRFATALADAETTGAVAGAALAALRFPAVPKSGSVAVVRGDRLELLATTGIEPPALATLERTDVTASVWLADVLRGRPALVDDRAEFARDYPDAKVLQYFDSGSWAVIPYRAAGSVGMLAAHYANPEPLSEHALFFSLCAEILATALERAGANERQQAERAALEAAFAERDRIARTLSTSLLPPRLPAIDGFEIDGWLAPSSGDEVAGDFYDLFSLPAGGWVAIIGDVCGKGAEAAAVTSLARYAARVGALDDPDPAHIAKVANDALLVDRSELYATMAIIRCHPLPDTTIDIALAGHLQPRLLTAAGVTRVGTFGRPIGLTTVGVTVTPQALAPGETLVLFTDGLVERDVTLNEDQLDAHLAALTDRRAPAVAADLNALIHGTPVHRHDDVAVLVIGRTV